MSCSADVNSFKENEVIMPPISVNYSFSEPLQPCKMICRCNLNNHVEIIPLIFIDQGSDHVKSKLRTKASKDSDKMLKSSEQINKRDNVNNDKVNNFECHYSHIEEQLSAIHKTVFNVNNPSEKSIIRIETPAKRGGSLSITKSNKKSKCPLVITKKSDYSHKFEGFIKKSPESIPENVDTNGSVTVLCKKSENDRPDRTVPTTTKQLLAHPAHEHASKEVSCTNDLPSERSRAS